MPDPVGGVDWVAVRLALWTWSRNGCALPDAKVYWGEQDSPRPESPAVALRISNIAETGRSWLDYEPASLTFTDKTVTLVDPTTDRLTIVGHGLDNGDGPVQLHTTGTPPGGTAVDTDYWVIVVDADHISLATTFQETGGQLPGGIGNPVTAIDITSAGTGTLKVVATSETIPAAGPIRAIARTLLKVSLEMQSHALGIGMDAAMALPRRILARREWPTQMDLLFNARIGLIEVERVRAIQGVRDAVLFEPRALGVVHFCVPCEESQAIQAIEQARITDQVTGRTFDVSQT